MITEECHKEALAAAQTPMFASKSSDIQVAPMPGVKIVDAAKYQAYLGVKSDQGEEAATASVGPAAHAPQDTVTMKTATAGAETMTHKGDANPQCKGNANPSCDPTRLCEALREMNNSLEHLEDERSRNIILVTSTQVHYLSHHTVQYGAHLLISTFTVRDSSEGGSASRVARSSVATSCTYVSAINASKCNQYIHCV